MLILPPPALEANRQDQFGEERDKNMGTTGGVCTEKV